VCLVVPIKKIGDYPDSDEDDAAGRHYGGTGTQAKAANEAAKANANDPDEAQA
jgi:hypothetical protein